MLTLAISDDCHSSFDGANIGAIFCILSFCRIFLSQFNNFPPLLNGC